MKRAWVEFWMGGRRIAHCIEEIPRGQTPQGSEIQLSLMFNSCP